MSYLNKSNNSFENAAKFKQISEWITNINNIYKKIK